MRKKLSSCVLCPDYDLKDGLIYFKNRLWLAEDSNLITKILEEYHNSVFGGHLGVDRTFHRIRNVFIWKGMRHSIKKFVDSCVNCQRMKIPTKKSQGLQMPLPIPEAVW